MSAIFRQFGRTIADTFRWQGRSRRQEATVYLLLSQAAMALLRATANWLAPEGWAAPIAFALAVLVLVPAPALVVRRFHDFAVSGKWGFILLAPVVRSLGLDLAALLGGWEIRSPIEAGLSYVDGLLTLPFIAVFLLVLAAPGSKGDNRFGADPRADRTPRDCAEGDAPAALAKPPPMLDPSS